MRYEYGVQTIASGQGQPGPGGWGPVTREPTKRIAEDVARNWVISPLRTSPRSARTVRRAVAPGRPLGWEVLNTWTTPESAQ